MLTSITACKSSELVSANGLSTDLNADHCAVIIAAGWDRGRTFVEPVEKPWARSWNER